MGASYGRCLVCVDESCGGLAGGGGSGGAGEGLGRGGRVRVVGVLGG